jgi:cell division protein YceG involved in septum cleavage
LPVLSDEAEMFINMFVENATLNYGNHFVVYNVHSMKHIVEECRNNGVLDSFSAFAYENELKSIKQKLKSGYKPLHQIAKRHSENTEKIAVILEDGENSIKLVHSHFDADEEERGEHFKEIHVNNVTWKLGKKDSYFMTNVGNVFILENIVSQGRDLIKFTGKRFI